MHKFLIIIALFLLNACGSPSPKDNPSKIQISASSVPQAELLAQVQKPLLEEGFDLDIQVVDDYNVPNRALANEEIDANFFQHKPFLDEQIRQFNYPICALAKIHVEPIGLYSKEKSIDDFKAGGTISIPNDPTNEARALLLLEKAGLITLDSKDIFNITVVDIKENPKKFKFIEVDAALLARTLSEVDASVIPTNYALLADLSPQKDALLMEDKDSPYVNVIAVRCKDLNSPKLLALKKIMQSEAMKEYILSHYKGALVPGF